MLADHGPYSNKEKPSPVIALWSLRLKKKKENIFIFSVLLISPIQGAHSKVLIIRTSQDTLCTFQKLLVQVHTAVRPEKIIASYLTSLSPQSNQKPTKYSICTVFLKRRFLFSH